MNLTNKEFCNKLRSIIYKAEEFDCLFSDLSKLQCDCVNDYPVTITDNLSILRDDCLTEMCEYLTELTVIEPHNQYVKFVTSCIIYYIWSIDGSEPYNNISCTIDYDYYFDLVTMRVNDSNELPEDFSNSMLFKAALAACELKIFIIY